MVRTEAQKALDWPINLGLGRMLDFSFQESREVRQACSQRNADMSQLQNNQTPFARFVFADEGLRQLKFLGERLLREAGLPA